MNMTAMIETLPREEQVRLLHRLIDALLPLNEPVYTQRANGRASRMMAEERIDYEVTKPRTFQDYFKLNLPADEISDLLGYIYKRESLDVTALNRKQIVIDTVRLANLLERIKEGLQHVGMNSEMARREFLIAPVLSEVIHYTGARVYVEYSVKASDSLQGSLDYLFKTEQQLLVIEAKHGDLQRGFHQLMAELAALDLKKATDAQHLYGIVSMGDGWQFGRLDRQSKTIIQDTEFYSVPMNTELLIRIMVGILQGA